MQRLYKNSQVKRIIARLLVVLICINYFINSLCSGVGVITAEADSNDRRRTWIELSQGKQTTELTEIENIDKESLRIIALYLSNYYIPFSTVLAGQAGTLTTEGDTDEEASDAEKEITNYQQIMTDALVNDLGFDKEAASYLVGLTVESSLASCQMLFMKESDFDDLFDGEEGDFSLIGSGNSNPHPINITNVDTVKSKLKTMSASVGDETVSFISVSYGILLECLNEDDDDYNKDIKFYWIDNGVAKEVFSNSENDKMSYVLANKELNYKNGIGSSVLSVPPSVAEKYDANDVAMVTAMFMPLYIDWVGNIVCNIGTGALVIFPACMNTNSFAYIQKPEKIEVSEKPLNFVNSITLYEIQKGHIKFGQDIVVDTKSEQMGYYYDENKQKVYVEIFTMDELNSMPIPQANGIKQAATEYKADYTTPVVRNESIPLYTIGWYDNSYSQNYNEWLAGSKNMEVSPYELYKHFDALGQDDRANKYNGTDMIVFKGVGKGGNIKKEDFIDYLDYTFGSFQMLNGLDVSYDDTKGFILNVVIPNSDVNTHDGISTTELSTGFLYYITYDSNNYVVAVPIVASKKGYSKGTDNETSPYKYVKISEDWIAVGSDSTPLQKDGVTQASKGRLSQCTGQVSVNNTFMVGIGEDSTINRIKTTSYINIEDYVMMKESGFSHNYVEEVQQSAYYSFCDCIVDIETAKTDITATGYQIYVPDGDSSGTLISLNCWRREFGDSTIEWDEKWGWGNSGTMEGVMSSLADNGIGFDSGENTYSFPKFSKWYSHRSRGVALEGEEHYGLVGIEEYNFLYYGLTDIIYYDTLAEITDETALSDLFYAIDIYEVATDTNNSVSSTSLQAGDMSYFGCSEAEKAIASLSGGSGSKFAPCLFYTYVFGYFNKDYDTFSQTDNIINMKLTFDNYPQVTGAIDWSFTAADTTGDEIMSFVYYLLHPTKGIQYVATWFKNKVSGILVGWHEDIVGSSDSNSSTGVTRYLGFTGYTTLPSLYDVEWIAGILDSYNNIIVYLIILIAVILLCYILTGNMTTQRGILGLLMFSILAFLPPVAINAVVNTTNRVSDTIYGDKFDYWALVQMQQYIIELDNAKELKEQGDMTSYANFIISNYTSASTSDSVGGASETGYTGVKLKWVSPKKYNITANVSDAMDSVDTDADYIKTILLNTVANNISGESYLDSESALYLYRDYLDIYRYASCSYNLYTTFNFAGEIFNDSTMNIGGVATTGSNSVVDVWSQAQVHTGSFVSGIQANATDSELLSTMKYTSGVPLATLILANAEGSSAYSSYFISPDFVPTSSLFATRKGFLYRNAGYTLKTQGDITEYSDSISSEKIIYYNQDTTLATSLLLNYTDAYEQVAKNRHSFQTNIIEATDTPQVEYSAMKNGDVVWGIDSYHFNYDVANITGQKTETNTLGKYTDLSYYYYGLYTESPFYFFSFNIQDQLNTAKRDTTTGVSYKYNYDRLQDSSGSMKALFLHDNQNYFFNLENTSGDGYGEMRDYMNMHDFFYYIVPVLREGTDLVKEFDDIYGMYTYDSCPLYFQSDGTFIYGSAGSDANKYEKLDDNFKTNCWDKMNDQEKYEFWHDYNVNTLFNQYSAWLDTMLDCDYADSETIEVAGEKFVVRDPLDPTSYFTYDESTDKITAGRYMVFSRSEMKYYGLSWEDLTQVEQKIITVQDNVYSKSIDLMNYYTLSDETLIQAYAMIQLFEFNKEFSQTSLVSDDYILYPQSYELKAFTYDAYLRLIISGTTGEDLMTTADNTDPTNVTTNVSIYQRVLENTSIFFGIVLLINDFIAVYILPAFKLFFLLLVFFMSIAMIVSSAIKLELNLVKAVWSSLLAPMLSFALVSIGMAWLVSKFMSEGAQGVVQTSHLIQLGDPTMVICVMVVINVVALILYFKILKKAFKDLVNYVKAISASISGAVVGTLGSVTGAFTNGRKYDGSGSSSARTAKQRGADNDPKSGKSGLRPAIAGAALGAGANEAHDAAKQAGLKSKYDSKAYNKLEAKKQKQQDKLDRFSQKAEQKQNRLDAKENKLRQGGNKEKLERFLAKREKGIDKSIRKMDKLQNNSSYYAKKQANIKNMGRLGALKANTKLSVGRKFQQVGSAGASVVNTASSVASGAKKGATIVRNGASSVKKGAKKAYNVVRDAKLSDIPTGISTGVRTCAKNTGRYITKAGRNVADKAKAGANFAKHNVVKGYNNTINS